MHSAWSDDWWPIGKNNLLSIDVHKKKKKKRKEEEKGKEKEDDDDKFSPLRTFIFYHIGNEKKQIFMGNRSSFAGYLKNAYWGI